jgi:mannitol 2-dehydrogenase
VTRLDTGALAEIGARVPIPAYDRAQVRGGIVHIGVGAFHRTHLAVYVDDLLSRQAVAGDTDLDWGITGVGLLPGDARIDEVLAAQDGLYTLVVKNPDGSLEPRVIGSLLRFLFAPRDPEAVLSAMTDPATRIVSLTITEGGYHLNQATGQFDSSDPVIQEDLSKAGPPRSAFGVLSTALARRRAAGLPPFTVLSCDNIPGNGSVARRMLTSFVRLTDSGLADWIESKVSFPNSMVDRITPVTTEADRDQLSHEFGVEDEWPVVCEPFRQWVIEDRFGDGRPDWAAVGAQLVEDVEPFELMKLRLLNASHQAMCYLGYLAGYRYAHEVCTDPLFVDFLLGYMEDEGSPTLPPLPGVDLDGYRRQLITRFANPAIRDSLARLCAESSDRIPKWLVPVVRDQLARGGPVRRCALVVASWARYAEGVDEQGQPIEIVDRRRDELKARAQLQGSDPLAFLRDASLFGDLVDREPFTTPYVEALASLKHHGARATLENWSS